MATTNQITHSRGCGFPLVRVWAGDISASSLVTTLTDAGRVCRVSEQWQGNGWVEGMSALPNTYLPRTEGWGCCLTAEEWVCVCLWVWVSACVPCTHSFGLEWRLHLFVLQLLPVDVAEEGVLLDVSLALRATAQTLTWVLGHELKHTDTRKVDDGSLRLHPRKRVFWVGLKILLTSIGCCSRGIFITTGWHLQVQRTKSGRLFRIGKEIFPSLQTGRNKKVSTGQPSANDVRLTNHVMDHVRLQDFWQCKIWLVYLNVTEALFNLQTKHLSRSIQ